MERSALGHASEVAAQQAGERRLDRLLKNLNTNSSPAIAQTITPETTAPDRRKTFEVVEGDKT